LSQEAAKSFLAMVDQDAALKAQIKGLKGDEGKVLAEVVKIGAAKKLTFTADEMKSAAKTRAGAGKLDEKQLDKVAGGGCKVILLSVAVCSD
jgi:hypothetical protein